LRQTGDERAWWARHGILDPLVSHHGRRRSPQPPAMTFEDEFEDVSARPTAQPNGQPNGGCKADLTTPTAHSKR
jgi:hypothetical protein